MVGSLYKLIAKVFADRLKKVMNGLVNPAQNAFVEGRQILDCILDCQQGHRLDAKEKGKGDPL